MVEQKVVSTEGTVLTQKFVLVLNQVSDDLDSRGNLV